MSNKALLLLHVTTVLLVLAAFEGGLSIGRWRSRLPEPEAPVPVRAMVASILGLLTFMLGFTFHLAASHYDTRADGIFNEAIALRTAYHRADLLRDPDRANIKHLLRRYVDLRLEISRSHDVNDELRSLRSLQSELWATAVESGKRAPGPAVAPLIQSLTEVIDVHGERALAGIQSRIPTNLWIFLYAMTVLSVAPAGYLAGLEGTRRSFAALGYAFAFATVIVMIAAADVPREEQSQLAHRALNDLRNTVMEDVGP